MGWRILFIPRHYQPTWLNILQYRYQSRSEILCNANCQTLVATDNIIHYTLAWLLCCCFTALRHFSGHFRCGQLTYQHCSWASLLGSLPVLSARSFTSNFQLPFLNQQKGKNCHWNYFMTNLHERMLPDMRIEPTNVHILSGRTSGLSTMPGYNGLENADCYQAVGNNSRLTYSILMNWHTRHTCRLIYSMSFNILYVTSIKIHQFMHVYGHTTLDWHKVPWST